MTLDKIEERILNDYDPIRLQGFYKKEAKKMPVYDFIIAFLQELTTKHGTIHVKTKDVLCVAKKRRSLGDIYMIVKYYYPKATLTEVVCSLFSLVGKEGGWRYTWCSQTNRKMFYYAQGRGTEVQRFQNDEFSNNPSYYQTIQENESI